MILSRPAVIGVDPGMTTGIALLELTGDARALSVELVQCTPDIVRNIVRSFSCGQVLLLAVEKFVVGPRATRSSTPAAGRITRELIVELADLDRELDCRVVLRSAAEVKPWATDARLKATGLSLPKGMPHALDALRHALFAAVADCGIPDPLSRRGT